MQEKRMASYLFIGGTSTQADVSVYRSSCFSIVIGTPGKLREICEKAPFNEQISFKTLEVLILGIRVPRAPNIL